VILLDAARRRAADVRVAPIRAVFFDVGETIVDESREYGAWADWLKVPRHTFSAVLGAIVAAGDDHREAFGRFKVGFDLGWERRLRAEAGQPERLLAEDLYPDAVPCLEALRAMGLTLGVAGNQTGEAEAALRALGLPVDVVGSSASWGAAKPSPGFFARMVEAAGCPARSVLHVGDRVDNDIRPAQEAGLATAFVQRGPWGHLRRDPPVEARCLFRMPSLVNLPERIRRHNDVG
jgi:HAD superfamily hydrolase (TIGR01549 family)